jgi:hypothetical protein
VIRIYNLDEKMMYDFEYKNKKNFLENNEEIITVDEPDNEEDDIEYINVEEDCINNLDIDWETYDYDDDREAYIVTDEEFEEILEAVKDDMLDSFNNYNDEYIFFYNDEEGTRNSILIDDIR